MNEHDEPEEALQPSSVTPPAAVLEASTALDTAAVTVHSPLAGIRRNRRFFYLIGRVAAQMAQYEHILDLTIFELMQRRCAGLQNAAVASPTAHFNGAQSRLEAIKTLSQFHGLPTEIVTECNRLVRETRVPQMRRNRLVHDAWFEDADSKVVSRFEKMPRPEQAKKHGLEDRHYGLRDVSAFEMRQTVRQISWLCAAAYQLRSAVNAALTPSPGR